MISVGTLEFGAEEVPAGDHWVVLLRILALDFVEAVAPRVFHGSKFHRLLIA